jgi:YHS domain-containing protein
MQGIPTPENLNPDDLIDLTKEEDMQSCQVCGNPVTESIEQETGRTMSGAKEIDPTAGTKRFWDGQWYYFDTLACRAKFESSPNSYLEG